MAAVLAAGALLAGCAAPGGGVASTAGMAPPGSAQAGQAAPGTSAAGTPAPPLPACADRALPTLTPGTLTVGTGSPTATPWFVGESPATGQGLESAVAYAIAQALGYGPDAVAWSVVDRAKAGAGTAGGFDFDLNQFTAPDAGTATADYSTGYFALTDTLVTRAPAVSATSAAQALQGTSAAAVTGSSGASAVKRVAGKDAVLFPDQKQALAALSAGSVAGVVLSTPAALTAVAADPTLAIVGQLPSDPEIQPEQFKALLPKRSALTGCVSAAIDRLRVEGTLEQLAERWVDPVAPQLG